VCSGIKAALPNTNKQNQHLIDTQLLHEVERNVVVETYHEHFFAWEQPSRGFPHRVALLLPHQHMCRSRPTSASSYLLASERSRSRCGLPSGPAARVQQVLSKRLGKFSLDKLFRALFSAE